MLIKQIFSAIDPCYKQTDLIGQEINHLSCNSRDITQNSLFFALKGTNFDGHDYIEQAIASGAKFVIYDAAQSANLAQKFGLDAEQKISRYKDAYLYASSNIKADMLKTLQLFYPAKPKNIVAVTGTSGKSSVAHFTNQIWQNLDIKSSYIGTLGISALPAKDGKILTTPDILSLHKILYELKALNIDNVVMEASSHGIEQGRLAGLNLQAAAFTNLGRDHLDYHQDQEQYFLAKMQLFTKYLPANSPAIINADCDIAERALHHIKSHRKILTIGKKGQFIKLLHKNAENIELEILDQRYQSKFHLLGEFQLYNAITALALVIASCPDIDIYLAVEQLQKLVSVSGRMQLIGSKDNGAKIYVDYAHKPEALQSLLQELRKLTEHNLIAVFGCGGNRDKGKRALMGEIAQNLADKVIITDDNPRYEAPAEIRAQILQHCAKAQEIGNRKQAIKEAIDLAQKGDIVVIAGKGHETGQEICGKIEHFSDEEEIINILRKV